MTDLVFLHVRAGGGGDGKVSFRREKYIPKGGPDGGDGGHGGSIYVRGVAGETTLRSYAGKKGFAGQPGEKGMGRNCSGGNGEDLYLEVPIGTVIWQLSENNIAHRRRLMNGGFAPLKKDQVETELYILEKDGITPPEREPDALFNPEAVEKYQHERFNPDAEGLVKLVEFTQDGQEYLLVQGGFGGKGNDTFKSSVNQAPLQAQYGTFGEERLVAFELRLLADVGLVGLPNAGKSTLLSILTKARPKIASYPFTTLEPHLGIMHDTASGREVVLADIPGLIAGASEGKGLGFEFLRHVKNSSALVYLLSLEEGVVFDESLTNEDKAKVLFEQYQTLHGEIAAFDPKLAEKRSVLSISKIDIYSTELIDAIRLYFSQQSHSLIFFSSVTGAGMAELQESLVALKRA
jgi:GTP-binding protein